MKKLLLLSALLFGVHQLSSQILEPVKWSTRYEKVSDNEYDLIFTADIDEGWVIYSQNIEEGGPIPTAFYFDESDHYERVGKVEESGHIKSGYEELFDMDLIKLYDQGVFTQRVRVTDTGQPITGYLEFMTCNDAKCLPPTEEEFSFDLPAAAQVMEKKAAAPEKETASPEEPEAPAPEKKEGEGELSLEAPLILPADEEKPSGILEPVQWSGELKKITTDTYELQITGDIQDGWAVYSQYLDSQDGPLPTTFYFDEGAHYEREGKTEEAGGKKEGFDPVFKMNVTKFAHNVIFTQRIRTNDPSQPVTGAFEYMACDDTRCLPPTETVFRADLQNGRLFVGTEAEAPAALSEAEPTSGSAMFVIDKPDLEAPAGSCGEKEEEVQAATSYWGIFALGFIGGLLALLTPCVFPMIPLTVSFFTKSSGDRRKGLRDAVLYGFFILLVYLVLSAPFHLMDSINPDILNDISTNIWLNLFFFVVFLFFAFSFFGYYELTLPSSWTNRASAAEGIGGAVGIFFMALTLALVSFSCTGPILGSLLAGALTSNGGAWQLTAGMGGFGLALALPFTVFAAFPGLMNTMPKSGGWLNTVKVTLGFLELALALKFLSNADLVKHWGILKIEPFLALWMLIFLGLGLYLLGVIRFPHDTPLKFKEISAPRKMLGALSFAFTLYLATGFTYDAQAGSYRSLKLLSGLAPPVCYSWFQPCDCPQNLNCFKDFEEGITYAREVDKPVIVDFTGHACVNCRKMEEHVWPENSVYKRLKNDYVLISLYVDEKLELPEEEQIVVPKTSGGTRKLRTTGQKWSYFQTEYFQTNSQPYYVLLSPEGELLNAPVGYTPDSREYTGFLECGLEAFRELTERKESERKQLGKR